MNIFDVALWGAAVPALLVFFAILLAGGRQPHADTPAEPSDQYAVAASPAFPLHALLIPLAIAVGLTVAFISIMGPLKPWPIESVRRVPHALALAVVLAVIASRARASIALLGAGLLATGASAWCILEVLARNGRMDNQTLWASVAILACIASPAAAFLAKPARAGTIPRLTLSIALLCPFLCLSAALMLAARTESGARLAGAAVAICAALAASAILPGRFTHHLTRAFPASTIVLVTLLVALLAWGRFFAGAFTADAWHPGLPWSSLALFALAPTIAAGLIPGDRSPTRRRRALILGMSASASIAALVLALATRPQAPAMENPYGDITQDP